MYLPMFILFHTFSIYIFVLKFIMYQYLLEIDILLFCVRSFFFIIERKTKSFTIIKTSNSKLMKCHIIICIIFSELSKGVGCFPWNPSWPAHE